MKLVSIFLGLLTLFLSIGPAAAVLPGVTNWWGKCHNDKPAIANAIGHFCKFGGLNNHVPRAWSIYGSHSDPDKFDRKAYVAIRGSCSPQEWVPRKYCYLQFYKMCVQFPGAGAGVRSFGTNGCQSWQIMRGPIPGGKIGQ
ncbi:uncharacterized protein LTR77_003091 [Saxophila tyrrhenica]|uniref:Uncharacterized protein n=1 Tax=Saxophila tyrrhenica TaxID=1690608 RepID=A0AAV9PJ75_9PEZI|nr:hypothetical protein LTR77_003091 [Saxophila tyrrhenica]